MTNFVGYYKNLRDNILAFWDLFGHNETIKMYNYEPKPNLYVGFDKEIKIEAYKLIMESQQIQKPFKKAFYKMMNKIPIDIPTD